MQIYSTSIYLNPSPFGCLLLFYKMWNDECGWNSVGYEIKWDKKLHHKKWNENDEIVEIFTSKFFEFNYFFQNKNKKKKETFFLCSSNAVLLMNVYKCDWKCANAVCYFSEIVIVRNVEIPQFHHVIPFSSAHICDIFRVWLHTISTDKFVRLSSQLQLNKLSWMGFFRVCIRHK